MSDEIGTYTFLPWLRQGLANQIKAPADASAKRGEIAVRLSVSGEGLTDPADEQIDKQIALYGPGDIVGIDSKAIVKSEPLNWITNFEPNYLPYIDFYDEDFPWRYTPNAASGDRLVPWLTLLVLAEGEFDNGQNMIGRELNYITLSDSVEAATVFPAEADLWAWAHVHVDKGIFNNGDDPVSTDESAFIGQFNSTINSNPDMAHSRLLSPRKLGENTAYHAFLVPTFESGRLAGLGIDPATVAAVGANTIAWADYSGRDESKSFPYYHRWYFRTGSAGDFEYLVRLLKPKVADSKVGRRDMDVLSPGSNIAGLTQARLNGILRLGGALQVPTACLNEEEATEYQNYDEWYDSYPHPFQTEMGSFINLADDYSRKTTADAHNDTALDIDDENPDDPDPLITPPLYARWHALTPRLLDDEEGAPLDNRENWVHELNLDPRWRTSANFGTEVVQDKQEQYMDAAWEQVGDVLDANRHLRWSTFAGFASKVWYKKNIQPQTAVAAERYLQLTTPVQRRVLFDGQTVFHRLKSSLVPQALVSATMRRISRPRGQLAKRLGVSTAATADNLISRANRGEISAAPPREVPDDLLTHDDIAATVKPAGVPGFLFSLLKRYPWIQYLPLLIGLLLIIILLLLGLASLSSILSIAIAAFAVFWFLRRLRRSGAQADGILPDEQTPESVDDLPNSPNFRVTEFGDPFVPSPGANDSAEATRFKDALQDSYDFVQQSAAAGEPPVYSPLDVPAVVGSIVASINPAVTIPRYTYGHISVPERLVEALKPETFVEAMAYPEIDTPMYKPLSELSSDHFVPNLNLIEQNSITLLETNQRFIEAYMVGLNHEFARELLWREYPTDQRGSYFRQFWDVSSYLDKDNLDDEALREKLRDIPPLHRWSRASELGDHDHREQEGDSEEEVVLVIRGELLKKYPTAVIYAHRARWAEDENGKRTLAEPRDFDAGDTAEVIKTPLYEAKVDPDIYFFGFDLTVTEAKGDSGESEDDKAGWFFVIKERPGEPRFGLDVPGDDDNNHINVTELDTWNDLAWSHVVSDVEAGKFISINGSRTISVNAPADNDDNEQQQQLEDSHLTWRSDMNAAELAYILYQVPVLMGVHAAEMLPDECNNEV